MNGMNHAVRGPAASAPELLDSRELFRLAVESCPCGMVIADGAGRIILVNSAIEGMFGYERGELLGRWADVLMPERFRIRHARPGNGAAAASGALGPVERFHNRTGLRKDGSEFPIELVLNPAHAGTDQLVFSVVVDISGRRESETHLALMEARYRGLLEAAPDAMVVVNEEGRIVLLNLQAEKQFGYRRDELLGQEVSNIIPAGFAERLAADALRSAKDAREQQIGTGIELAGRRKDGSAFPIEIMLSPLESEEGLLITAAIRNITARKGMERLKDEFVSTVSHELRTPLTSISGALGLLIGNAAGKLPDGATRLLAIAHANSQRLVRLINDILDIDKLESGLVVFNLKRVDVRSLVEQAIDANRGFAEAYGVQVRLGGVREELAVCADPDRLEQVITNLLSNAVKFSSIGDEVGISFGLHGGDVRISVRDHGPGVPGRFRSSIFDKFAQADATDSRQKGGTGLGLSIVREITQRLGGTVGFEDAEGGGTIFHVELPGWEEAVGPLRGRLPEGNADRLAGLSEQDRTGSHGLRPVAGRRARHVRESACTEAAKPGILHVEDDREARQLFARAIGSAADVVSVGSITAARRAIKAKQFDLAVLDLALDPGSGLDLLPALRNAAGQPIPVIVFSMHCADVQDGGQIRAALSKSKTSMAALLACVQANLAPSALAAS